MSYEKVKQAKHFSVGVKQTIKAVEQGLAQEVIIAKDADNKLTSKIIQICKENNLNVYYVDSMRKLGKACGIDVGASSVALMEDKIAR